MQELHRRANILGTLLDTLKPIAKSPTSARAVLQAADNYIGISKRCKVGSPSMLDPSEHTDTLSCGEMDLVNLDCSGAIHF